VNNINKKLLSLNEVRSFLKIGDSEKKRLFNAILLLFIIYCICLFSEIYIEGFVPLFTKRPDMARNEFGLFGIHLFVNSQLVIMYFCIAFVLLTKSTKSKKIIIWSAFLFTMLSYFTLLERFNYFVWIIITFLMIYYSSKLIKPYKLIIGGLVFFVTLYTAIQGIRLSRYVSSYIYLISKMKYSIKYAAFTEPYMYISMNLENFTRAVDKLQNHSLGFLTFDWLFALTGMKKTLITYFNVTDRPFLISGFNTFPFMWYYFSDFGVLGVGLLPFVFGLSISEIYYKMRIKPSFLLITLYSFGVAFIVLSFFTNIFTMLNYFVCIVLSVLICSYVFKNND
jgi:oligosaccharide repeat unit polymerase